MKVVVTGGGTGGHVYPALEVALELRRRGCEVAYVGSLRGQESAACAKAGVGFTGFPSEPLYRLTSLRGWRGAINLARARIMARRHLSQTRPDAVFSTGGYASAPVVSAASSLGVPFVLHEQNVVPGRTNRILSKSAAAVATTFRSGAEHFPEARVVRTGMPVRSEFRSGQVGFGLAQQLGDAGPILLVMGGSQGAQAINEAALATAVRMAGQTVQWLHVTGTKHFPGMTESLARLGLTSGYELRAFLQAEEMASAMFGCEIAVCRSGAGTLAELAAMRKPAILVPYPAAFADHQRLNALEFESIGAAVLLEEKELTPAALEARVLSWLGEADRQASARAALEAWDIPDAVGRIADLVQEGAAR